MLMFLTILCACLPILVLSALVFRGAASRPSPAARTALEVPPPRFFADDLPARAAAVRAPRELAVSQIERHVRLEQAAAEDFLNLPTPEGLYAQTASPLLN